MLGLLLPQSADARFRPPHRSDAVSVENVRAGTTGWEGPDASTPAVEAYASKESVIAGAPVDLHVSTSPASNYRIEVFRLGWYGGAGAALYTCIPSCSSWKQGAAQPHPSPDPQTGEVQANWPVTDIIRTSTLWLSGVYLARVERSDGGDPSLVVFVVRELPFRPSQILVELPVNTWQAYNFWGGKSLYTVISTNAIAANRVSFDRPWSVGSQRQFFAWSLALVRFLERYGYDVSYTTDVDVQRHPAELVRHRLVVVAGHGEYWTSTMRDAFDHARDGATNLAFMGANIGYWQVRYEDGYRTIVGYKSADDPVKDQRLETVQFRALDPPRFECELLGVQHQDAFRRRSDPQIPYTVTNAAANDPWFAGTGFVPGDVLPDLVGPEWDQVIGTDRTPMCSLPGLTVLFHYGGPPGPADAVRYTALSGARVFSAGSLQFVWGLDDFGTEVYGHTAAADPRLQRFALNMFDDLTRPAPPISLGSTIRGRTVALNVQQHPDGRVRIVILRHRGSATFDPAGSGTTVVCVAARACRDKRVPRGTFRYAAVATDRWAASTPVFGPPVSR